MNSTQVLERICFLQMAVDVDHPTTTDLGRVSVTAPTRSGLDFVSISEVFAAENDAYGALVLAVSKVCELVTS